MEYKKVKLKEYLECARAVNTHGVAGMLKMENRCDSPEVLAKLKTMYIKRGEEYVPMKVTRASVQKTMVLVKFEGVDSFEDAIKYKNEIFYAARGDFRLRRGDFFIADIIGLPVYDDADGRTIGTMKEVLSPVGQQVYVIEKPDGRTFMVPCVPEFIKEVSFGDSRDAGIYVKLIEGMEE
ncbi:MAG: 16S rRNA processing protein RimM [Clostridia bacterium]|nr:16S rRNA processing protein RimM [Clostridia bacterium]